MQRRTFLTIPLIASALITDGQRTNKANPKKGFKVEKGRGRNVEQMKVLGSTFDCKVSGKDTNGQLCIFDTTREGQTSPPLHLHHNQDEWFYVIKGEFKVQVGDEVLILREGDSAFAPRKIPHTFAKTSEGVGQMMIIFQPAGKMEEFFIERVNLESEKDPLKKEAALKTLWDRHGMKVVNEPKKV
ncbi:MAG TPA: cupin domain-containing protein [Chitinophagaceae bacterium]|nr:cupin domain-containing protein [Chitinophagaceae bacterium]